MIQELFGGGKDINIISSISFPPPLPFSSPPTPTPTSSTTTLANTSNSSSSVGNNNNNNNNNSNSETNNGQIKLRCPRCDSTNTKFCYYNNYNLTQPRHFCKTCRRYWTRGGTLRNVPIGGGCRKNKTASSTTVSTSSSSSSSAAISGFSKSTSFNALVRAATNCNTRLSADLLFPGNPGCVRVLGNGLTDPQTCPNPTFWPPPQSSHILALFNPSPLSSTTTTTTQGLFDPYGANGAPNPLGSFHRSHQVVNGFGLGPGPEPMVQNSSNIMELYQKLKSSSGGYGYCGHENHGPLNLGNVMGSSSSSTSTSTLASSSSGYIVGNVAGDNNNLASYGTITNPSWNEFSTVPINGAFP